MSDKTQVTMSYEAMKAELEAAGYRLRLQVRGSYISLPFDENADIGDVLIQSYNNDKNALIEYAYAHLQREKKFAAMEALLKDMLGNELYLDTDDRCHPSTQLMGWIRRAEELLK